MWRGLAWVIGVLVMGSACTGGSTSIQHTQAAGASPSATGDGTIVLDPPRGTERFASAGDAQPRLTADEALAVFQAVDPDFHEPSDTTVHLGYLTTGHFSHRLEWGFTWHECVDLRMTHPSPTMVPCKAWLFIDADTGRMLIATWQGGADLTPFP